MFNRPKIGFIIFLALMFLLVGSVKMAWEGELIASAALGLIFTISILAVRQLRRRIRRKQPPADESWKPSQDMK